MAEAYFDDGGPVGEYLREAGDIPVIMPGEYAVDDDDEGGIWAALHALRTPPFVEQLKYAVVSSSLLDGELQPHVQASAEPELTRGEALSTAEAPSWLILILVLTLFVSGYHLYSGALLLVLVWLLGLPQEGHGRKETMKVLGELILAGHTWDGVVADVLRILDSESRLEDDNALRIALSMNLLTTQTQCDNVRQLFGALTSEEEVKQLAGMYAPSIPVQTLKRRRSSLVERKGSKRETWNGTYSALAMAGSPPSGRREKRRSDLSALLGSSALLSPSRSAPPSARPLAEEPEEGDDSFGLAALDLQRKRRSGLPASPLSARFTSPRPLSSPSSTHPFFLSSSPSNHPLSLASLHASLRSALSARRYASAHLLALRFEESDEGGYWEDVRSVAGLLRGVLADAAGRMESALAGDSDSETSIEEKPVQLETPARWLDHRPPSLQFKTSGFAPVRSDLDRLEVHIDKMAAAMNAAKEALEGCILALDPAPPSTHCRSLSDASSNMDDDRHPALHAYDLLRRELGVALRESERGRADLISVLSPPAAPQEADEGELSSDSDEEPKTRRVSEHFEFDAHPAVSVYTSLPDLDLAHVDDDLEHLLASAPEQVFESTAEVGIFGRERSKISREERIRAKKEKEKVDVVVVDHPKQVVQELKDVIWRVGERRRKRQSEIPPAALLSEAMESEASHLEYDHEHTDVGIAL